jgi:hypothetical protein
MKQYHRNPTPQNRKNLKVGCWISWRADHCSFVWKEIFSEGIGGHSMRCRLTCARYMLISVL